jgi:hypothetical protein
MDVIQLPQHIVNRIERRWTARFAQMPEGRQPLERRRHRHRTEDSILSDRRKSGVCWKDP